MGKGAGLKGKERSDLITRRSNSVNGLSDRVNEQRDVVVG